MLDLMISSVTIPIHIKRDYHSLIGILHIPPSHYISLHHSAFCQYYHFYHYCCHLAISVAIDCILGCRVRQPNNVFKVKLFE